MREIGIVFLFIGLLIYLIIGMATIDEFVEKERRFPGFREGFYVLYKFCLNKSWLSIVVTGTIFTFLSIYLFYNSIVNEYKEVYHLDFSNKDICRLLIMLSFLTLYASYIVKRCYELKRLGCHVSRNICATMMLSYSFVNNFMTRWFLKIIDAISIVLVSTSLVLLFFIID